MENRPVPVRLCLYRPLMRQRALAGLLATLAVLPTSSASSVSLRSVAVCLVGQPRSVELTADAIHSNLLNHWEADAFIMAHAPDEAAAVAPSAAAVGSSGSSSWRARLVQLFGARAVAINVTRWNGTDGQDWWARRVGWHVHGHPHEQWTSRQDCVRTIRQHEMVRGSKYDVYLRMRLDTLLLQPVPTRYLDLLRAAEPCTALIPAGED